MATDVSVQFFSNFNGLTLANNWGDLIRLLDICLVNGKPLPSITSATIDGQGDVYLTCSTAHNVLLFQTIELLGFSPSNLNQKYRVKGVPNTTQLILKPSGVVSATTVSTIGTSLLSPLGYEIVFRDAGDVKRVYRAKNPSLQHPYIRVDESIVDGANSYASTYARSAMVGLIENMTYLDDYQDTSKLQLPLDTTDFSKNWKISGTGNTVIRGWAKWYWACVSGDWNTSADSATVSIATARQFTLCGDADAFYLINATDTGLYSNYINGCGLFNSAIDSTVIPPWFLMAFENAVAANVATNRPSTKTGVPLVVYSVDTSKFLLPSYNPTTRVSTRSFAVPILPTTISGSNGTFSVSPVAALEIPFSDEQGFLRGTLKHVCYSGKNAIISSTTTLISGSSMYVQAPINASTGTQGFVYLYLGELE